MKTILLIFLLSISLIAAEKEVPKPQNAKQELTYIIDAKNYVLIDAKKAFFVVNSHKYGTMQDYFAFADEKDAKEYVEKNGGSVVDYETYMKFDENSTK
ncbi:MAG: nitrous oxide reductase accessory protein NosL [Sulfurimonas sp.]